LTGSRTSSAATPTCPAAEIIRSLHQGVLAFSCGTPQLDDLATVVIKRV
jgi:hypothetical protein